MRKFLLPIILLWAFNLSAQTFNYTPTSLGTLDYMRYGHSGATLWNDQNAPYGTMHIPTDANPEEPVDAYYRFSWTQFFTGTGSDSTINWGFFRSKIIDFIEKGQGARIRIMSVCNNCGNPDIGDNFNDLKNYGGGWNAIPQFLHTLMQAEAIKDWFCTVGDQDQWIPNWNSLQYRRWVDKFMTQFANYVDTAQHTIATGPRAGTWKFRDCIRIWDLSFYGAYGEQHSADLVPNGNNVNFYPDGTFDNDNDYTNGTGPLEASLDSIAAKQLRPLSNKFPWWHFVVPFNAYDAEILPHTWNPPGYGRFLLDWKDSIGFIDDHLGAKEGYDLHYLDNNDRMGTGYKAKLLNRWKWTPQGGEPVDFGSPADRSGINDYVLSYHLSFFGNGNLYAYTNDSDPQADNVRLAAKNAGYRIRQTSVSATLNTTNLNITGNWINSGICPTYEPWKVEYLLKTTAGTLVWTSAISTFKPQRFLPSGSAQGFTDNFTRPAIPAGNYNLFVRVRDSSGYYPPMRLHQQGRQTGGEYLLGPITFSGAPTNQAPTANAGQNVTITLPTSSTPLTGSSTDADGTIASVLWTQTGGPVTAVITPNNTNSTTISGLTAPGLYTFVYSATDDDGATTSDAVNVTVNNAIPPTADAGPNIVITLPTTSTTLVGNGTDDVGVASYLWTKISGPNTFVIASPTTSTTNITGLTTAGTYVFRLRVTDVSGLTATDDAQVIVNPAPNAPPVAVAGINQQIILPASAIVNGSASTDDGTIVTYLWLFKSGTPTYNIVTPNNVSTTITFSAAGTYEFTLRVTDNFGLTATDDIQIVVLPAPNGAPTADAGANQVIQLPTTSTSVDGSNSFDAESGVTYLWIQVGTTPSVVSFGTPTAAITTVTGLTTPGFYTIRLIVEDDNTATAFDDMTIQVVAAVNQPPVAEAGLSTHITFGDPTTLDGTGSTDDNGIVAYRWYLRYGEPSGLVISTPNASTTDVSGFSVVAPYTFYLEVTDAQGLKHTDGVVVWVDAAPNETPIASAAVASANPIQLPVDTVDLTAGSSSDADGTIIAFFWEVISGPPSITFDDATSSTTTIRNLQEGVYTLRLTITDDQGATDTDDLVITVLAADPPDPPIVGDRVQRLMKFVFKYR